MKYFLEQYCKEVYSFFLLACWSKKMFAHLSLPRMLYDYIIARNILVIYNFLVSRKFPVHLHTWRRQVHSGIVLLEAWCTFVNMRNEVSANERRSLPKETVESALPVNILYSADKLFAIINSSLDSSWLGLAKTTKKPAICCETPIFSSRSPCSDVSWFIFWIN